MENATTVSCHSIVGDCLDVTRNMNAGAVDLVFGSPPYESARTYGIGFKLRGQEWVDWMLNRWLEFARVSRGPVVMVVAGQTKGFQWSAAPALLMADLHRNGFNLRTPPIFKRVGIPGSGGPDWLRNDYEFCIVTTPPGRLAWSDNTAMGHTPKWSPGGAPSHRLPNGRRCHTKRTATGTVTQRYTAPARANPGNVIACVVGGGRMGSPLAHENEAPFPEALAEFFIRSFCPPGGTVLDPFSGSGTTAAVATKAGRNAIAIDVRPSQITLTKKRLWSA